MIPPWIFISAKLFSSCSQIHPPALQWFRVEFYDFVGLVHQPIIIIIIITIIILLLTSFSSPATAEGLSLETERQQVSLGLLDFYYSGWSQRCSTLGGLESSSNFQLFKPPFYAFRDCSKCANYKWYHCHPHVLHLSLFSSKVLVFVSFFAFFDLPSVVSWDGKVYYTASFLVFVNYHQVWSSGGKLAIGLHLKISSLFTLWEFFTPVLANDLSLEFEG